MDGKTLARLASITVQDKLICSSLLLSRIDSFIVQLPSVESPLDTKVHIRGIEWVWPH